MRIFRNHKHIQCDKYYRQGPKRIPSLWKIIVFHHFSNGMSRRIPGKHREYPAKCIVANDRLQTQPRIHLCIRQVRHNIAALIALETLFRQANTAQTDNPIVTDFHTEILRVFMYTTTASSVISASIGMVRMRYV